MGDRLILELFCCSGGMAEGFRRAGIPVDVAFDADPDACASYERNLGHRPIHMDIRDLLRMVADGWRPGPIDLVVADPPCTPWSRAGKRRGVDDHRDMLLDTVEIIRRLMPAAYLIGNVPGLEDSTQWGHLQRALAPLAGAGYCVADFITLDAADYGVPQRRIRPFWFGHLEGDCIRWPAPSHCDPGRARNGTLPGIEALRPWVTVREALESLPAADLGRPVRLRKRAQHSAQHGSVASKPARVVGTSNLSDGNVLLLPLEQPDKPPRPWHNPHPPSNGDEPSRTITTRSLSGHGGGGSVLLLEATRADGTSRDHELDEPGKVVTAAGRSQRVRTERRRRDGTKRDHETDRPAHTVSGQRETQVLVVVDHHPPNVLDDPGRVIRASSSTTPDKILRTNSKHPIGKPDAPSPTVAASGGGAQGGRTVEWPWERPSTTVCARDTIPPPGHHPESGSILSQPGAIVLSERAAARLQGFPDGWYFAGKTKTSRWSQIGQAMPPALAEAVARSVADWMRRYLHASKASSSA